MEWQNINESIETVYHNGLHCFQNTRLLSISNITSEHSQIILQVSEEPIFYEIFSP